MQQYQSPNHIVALDLGNSDCKIKTDTQEFKFPSTLIEENQLPKTTIDFGGTSMADIHKIELSITDKIYCAGPDLSKISTGKTLTITRGSGMQRYTSEAFKAMALFALAMAGASLPDNQPVDIYIALPTNDANNPKIKQQLKTFFNKVHKFVLDGKIIKVDVNSTAFAAQYIGTPIDLSYDFDLEKTEAGLLEKNIGIVDIGGGTILTDVSARGAVGDSRFSHVYDNEGVVVAYLSPLRQKLANRDIKINEEELIGLLKNSNDQKGYIFTPGNPDYAEDLTNDLTDMRHKITERIIEIIKSQFDLKMLSEILITGGGAYLVYPEELKKSFSNITIVEDSEMSNVRGLYKLAMINSMAQGGM